MKKFLLVLSMISIILLAGCGAKTNTPASQEGTNNQEEDTITFVSKINDNQGWVYDADYPRNVRASSYSTVYDITYYAKDIIAPFINVNSEDTSRLNAIIREIFDNAIDTFNDGVADKMTYVDEFNYEKHVNDDLLSVVITYGVGGTDVVYPEYYTYNLDLKTGKSLSYSEVYGIAGFNINNITSRVHDAIEKKVKESELKESEIDKYVAESIQNYDLSIKNNTVKYFVDSNGKLNVVVPISIPAGRGYFNTILTID